MLWISQNLFWSVGDDSGIKPTTRSTRGRGSIPHQNRPTGTPTRGFLRNFTQFFEFSRFVYFHSARLCKKFPKLIEYRRNWWHVSNNVRLGVVIEIHEAFCWKYSTSPVTVSIICIYIYLLFFSCLVCWKISPFKIFAKFEKLFFLNFTVL